MSMKSNCELLSRGYLVALGALICVLGCEKECEQIDAGLIAEGFYVNKVLGWKMGLPKLYKQIQGAEYDQIVEKGNVTLSGEKSREGCNQVLLRLKSGSESESTWFIVLADPVSMYPRDFDMIEFLKEKYRVVSSQNGIVYTESDTVGFISGQKFRWLKSKFMGQETAYNVVYQTQFDKTLLLVLISGNSRNGVDEWIRLFESSSFGNYRILS